MNKTTLVLLIAVNVLLPISACKSKTVVKKLVNADSRDDRAHTKKIEGVMYQLPLTVIQASIPVDLVTKSPGKFEKFAPCFFSKAESDKRVKQESKEFSLDVPKFSSKGVPDPSETYVLQTKGHYFESKTLFVEYAPGSYVLQKGQSESKDETLDFTLKAVSTLAGVAAKVAPLAHSTTLKEDEDAREMAALLREEYRCYKIIGGPASLISAYIDTLSGKTPPYVDSLGTEQQFRDEYQEALAAFNKLEEIQGQRDEILNSPGNVPPETFKMISDANTEAIKIYRSAFLGAKSEKVWAATFEFTPHGTSDHSPLLFSFSKKEGVCNNGVVREKSMEIASGFENENCAASSENTNEAVWLNAARTSDQGQDDFLAKIAFANNTAEQKGRSRGWYYRVPADADVWLKTLSLSCPNGGAGGTNDCSKLTYADVVASRVNPTQVSWASMPVAQFGIVASVPSSSAGRSSTTAIELDPATGAMKNYKVSSSALLDKSLLDEAGNAANSTVDAADPLKRKKRELEQLKTQNEINDEKKKLANSNSNPQ